MIEIKPRLTNANSSTNFGANSGANSDAPTDQPVVRPEIREAVKEPAMYVVLVHNDPYTPRDFVVEVLRRCFQKTVDEASAIMLKAHRGGVGAVGIYTFEIAEMKCAQANKYAHDQGRLLIFSVEEV